MTNDTVNPLKMENDSLSDRAREYLLSLIDTGVYEPGQRLPSQVELANQLGISRGTLREALHDLQRQGVIKCKHGVGTFISRNYGQRIEGGLERLESILGLAAQQDLAPSFRELEVEQEPAEGELAERLGIAPGTPVTVVRRTIVVDSTAVAYMVDVVPGSLLALHHVDESFRGSVLDLLTDKLGLPDAWAVSEISTVMATDFLMDRLELSSACSLLLLKETLFDGEGKAVSFSENYFVSEHFRFRVIRR
jgi:GntR family transcriptional regulator